MYLGQYEQEHNPHYLGRGIMRVEDSGEVTILSGADCGFTSRPYVDFAVAFSIKNPTAPQDGLCVTSPWIVSPTGFPNDFINTDGRTLIVISDRTSDIYPPGRGINLFDYDFKRRWITREAQYMPPVATGYSEASVVQLRDGSHFMLYRAASEMRIVRSAGGVADFDPATDESASVIFGAEAAMTSTKFVVDMSPNGNVIAVYNKSHNRVQLTLALLNPQCTAILKEIELFAGSASYPQTFFDGGNIYVIHDNLRVVTNGVAPRILLNVLSESDFVTNGAQASLNQFVVATPTPSIKSSS